MTTLPIVTQPIDDLVVSENGIDTTIDLFQHFDDPQTTGKIARFELVDSTLGGGVSNVLLFDQAGAGAPETVENFLTYVDEGDYVNSIIHRSVPGFVVQGGGFTVEEFSVETIPADSPVVNEFSADRSNLRGTIAMAKLGGDPNSATNQWFFNLADNAANLDAQNGGFTVFGEVLTDADLAPVDAISNLPTFNASNIQPAFTNLPLKVADPANPVLDNDDNFVRFSNISVVQEDELKFELLSNSNPDLVNVTISEGSLVLDYAPDQSGTAEITLQATDLLGDSVEDTFLVTVEETVTEAEPNLEQRGPTIHRFYDNDAGVHLYTASEVELNNVLNNFPNYISEGPSFVSVDPLTGNPEPEAVYRFLNQSTGTHFYTISDAEKESVIANLSNFNFEGEAFFAYEEPQSGTIPIYRFFNTQTGGHFYTPSIAERDSVIDTLPSYRPEGIAYYAFPVLE